MHVRTRRSALRLHTVNESPVQRLRITSGRSFAKRRLVHALLGLALALAHAPTFSECLKTLVIKHLSRRPDDRLFLPRPNLDGRWIEVFSNLRPTITCGSAITERLNYHASEPHGR